MDTGQFPIAQNRVADAIQSRQPLTPFVERQRIDVKKTILRLNELNEEVDGSLIETDQREYLCKLIDLAAGHAGLESSADDITYKWREW